MTKKSDLLYWICTIAVLVSIGAHVYLTNHHYEVNYGMPADGGLCNINDKLNCTTTSTSSYSEIMGIGISIFGGLTNLFLLLFLLAAKFPIVASATQRKLQSPIKIFTLGIFGVSLVMGSISLFALNAICPVCSLTYLTSLIMLVTSWMYFGEKISLDGLTLKVLIGSAIGIFTMAFVLHSSAMAPYGGKQAQEMVRLQVEDWKRAPQKEITPVSPMTMNANPEAKVKVVEFADFLCGHCAAAFPIVHEFAKLHPEVEVHFQAFPLDGECNSAIPRAVGINCLLARVSHCAGLQSKGWETQEWIFKNQRQFHGKQMVDQLLQENYESLGLNMEELMSCVESDGAKAAIKAQADLGNQVGVRGTPSLFVNGRKVPAGFSIPLLRRLVKEAK